MRTLIDPSPCGSEASHRSAPIPSRFRQTRFGLLLLCCVFGVAACGVRGAPRPPTRAAEVRTPATPATSTPATRETTLESDVHDVDDADVEDDDVDVEGEGEGDEARPPTSPPIQTIHIQRK